MSFLPDNYKLPVAQSKYINLSKIEENKQFRVRILESAVVGYEYFNTSNKPVRSLEFPDKPVDIAPKGQVKEFWACVAYDYQSQEIKILQITQTSVKEQIIAFGLDQDLGSPIQYDLKITKTGKQLETRYNLIPGKIEPISADINKLYMESDIDLLKLFTGEDPFQK